MNRILRLRTKLVTLHNILWHTTYLFCSSLAFRFSHLRRILHRSGTLRDHLLQVVVFYWTKTVTSLSLVLSSNDMEVTSIVKVELWCWNRQNIVRKQPSDEKVLNNETGSVQCCWIVTFLFGNLF